MKYHHYLYLYLMIVGFQACTSTAREQPQQVDHVLTPDIITEKVPFDTDDPAIWINKDNPSESLIIGTDKGNDDGVGGLYTFSLDGKIIPEKSFEGLMRPNNVDIAYGLPFGDSVVDIAVCTERLQNKIRVFRLPEMTPIDGGGIPVFESEALRAPMGIALYKMDERIFAIVGRKNGPVDNSYLWQYELEATDSGTVTGSVVRKFGHFSGNKEIESIAVDADYGYVYYSDEGMGIHKYYAHPDSSASELALFGTTGFVDDHEGISIYRKDSLEGYILVSDQQGNRFQVFDREPPHDKIAVVAMAIMESDGSDVNPTNLGNDFESGIFVAMSDDGTFQIYNWEKIQKEIDFQVQSED